MEKGADFGLSDMEDLRQSADVIPIPGQGGLQRVEIRRQGHRDNLGRDACFPQPVGLLQGQRQIVLDPYVST